MSNDDCPVVIIVLIDDDCAVLCIIVVHSDTYTHLKVDCWFRLISLDLYVCFLCVFVITARSELRKVLFLAL